MLTIFVLCFLFCNVLEPSWAKTFPPGHLQPIGNSGPVHPIDHVDGFLPPKVFIEKYLKKNRPLLMRGAAKASPAFKLWNDAYLRSKTPPGKDGNVFVEHGKKENRSDPSGDMNFGDFLLKYNTSDIYMVNHVPTFLKQDLIMPFSIQCDSFNKSFADAVMWFSSGGTKSVLHNDNYENINCLYRGRKRLVFINATKYKSLTEKLIDDKHGHSSVDVEKVDLEKYPFFAGMEFNIVEMDPGDCLYIPLLWYHHVESFGSNLAVNVWFFSSDKIDMKTCREEYDKSLLLSKFDYSMKEESNEEENTGMVTKEKKKVAKEEPEIPDSEASPQFIDSVFSNLVSFLLPEEGSTVSKKEFLRLMTDDKKITAANKKVLDIIFAILDNNKNGKLDDPDVDTKISDKTGRILVKAVRKWLMIAKKLKLKIPNFLSETSPMQEGGASSKGEHDTMEPPVMDKTLRTSVESHEEL